MNAVQLQLEAREEENRHRFQTMVQHPGSEVRAARPNRRSLSVELLVQERVHTLRLVLQAGKVVQQARNLVSLSRPVETENLNERHENVFVIKEKRLDTFLCLLIGVESKFDNNSGMLVVELSILTSGSLNSGFFGMRTGGAMKIFAESLSTSDNFVFPKTLLFSGR